MRLKIITMTLLFCGLGASVSRAGDGIYKPSSYVQYEDNFRNTLWMDSRNAAGLGFRPMSAYNSLDISYDGESGDYRLQQRPGKSTDISLNTEGAVKLGGFLLWGDFSFRNIFDRKVRYNAIQYEIEDDNPYYVADTVSSNWNKQEYELATKIVSPVLWDRMTFGLHVHYTTKVGAKQLDPRCETYKVNVDVSPSAACRIGDSHVLGLSGTFRYGFERSKPSLNNMYNSVLVALTKGLGEYTVGKVGDNDGLSTYMFKGYTYGGAVQYSYAGKAEIFAELSFLHKDLDVVHNVTLPKNMGNPVTDFMEANVRTLFGENRSNSLNASLLYRKTTGTEHVQQLNTTAFNQKWEIVSSNDMSTYKFMRLGLGYDHQFGNADKRGYDWTIGGKAVFTDKSDAYYSPVSSFDATNAYVEIDGGRQLKFEKSSLVFGLDCGYNLNLDGGYVYGGSLKMLRDLYDSDAAYWSADWIKAGAKAAFTLNANKVNWLIRASADYVSPMDMDGSRLVCSAAFGIIF